MNIFRKFFISILIACFGLFLGNPYFAIANDEYKDVFLTQDLGDTCTWNIQCEEVGNSQYVCHSEGEVITGQIFLAHEIPVGKNSLISFVWYGKIGKESYLPIHTESLYIAPDYKAYPFVGTIKIQV